MKKFFIISLIVLSTLFFSLLIYQGVKQARGIPVVVKEKKMPFVEVPFVNNHIDLSKGIGRQFWDLRPATKIELIYQLLVIPWPKASVPYIKVKAYHNKEDIYFYLEWPDDTQDSSAEIKNFSDAGAVMFPLGKKVPTQSLMMGFLGKANIWHWKANQDREYWLGKKTEAKVYVDFYYPFEEQELFTVSKEKFDSAVNDLVAIRIGTITRKPIQNIKGRGTYNKGIWRVVFKRTLKAEDPEVDAEFALGKRLCAFAVWNGSKGDRGGRKSISNWVSLRIR